VIKQNRAPVASLLRGFAWVALAAGAAMALSACNSMKVIDDPSKVVSYVYRPQIGFVRIERIEAGAPDNAHPLDISVDALSRSLARLEVKGGAKIDTVPLFNDAELKEFAPPLAVALAKAGPKEDVCFAVIGKHGAFGSYSDPSVTSGRLFARDGKLNLIFGLVQELYQPFTELTGDNSSLVPPFPSGSRAQASNTGWTLLPKGGRLADGRTDWIVLDTTQPAAIEKPPGAPAAADSRYQEIENKLTVLNRLKEKGLITEEEYKERRRAILEGL
jgi:hypothetical protein